MYGDFEENLCFASGSWINLVELLRNIQISVGQGTVPIRMLVMHRTDSRSAWAGESSTSIGTADVSVVWYVLIFQMPFNVMSKFDSIDFRMALLHRFWPPLRQDDHTISSDALDCTGKVTTGEVWFPSQPLKPRYRWETGWNEERRQTTTQWRDVTSSALQAFYLLKPETLMRGGSGDIGWSPRWWTQWREFPEGDFSSMSCKQCRGWSHISRGCLGVLIEGRLRLCIVDPGKVTKWEKAQFEHKEAKLILEKESWQQQGKPFHSTWIVLKT